MSEGHESGSGDGIEAVCAWLGARWRLLLGRIEAGHVWIGGGKMHRCCVEASMDWIPNIAYCQLYKMHQVENEKQNEIRNA